MKSATSASASPSRDSTSETNATETPQACAYVQTLLIENAILSRAMARQQERHSEYVEETRQKMEQMFAKQSQLEQQVRELLQANVQSDELPALASIRSNLRWC
jgi:uncharacterized HAD superfamily protein